MLDRDRFRDIVDLRVKRDEIPAILPLEILHEPGMARVKNNQPVHAPDFSRQHVVEQLMQTPRAGIFVVEFDHLVEPQPSKGIGDFLGIADGSRNRRGQHVVFNPNNDGPRFVVEPFRFPQLGFRG